MDEQISLFSEEEEPVPAQGTVTGFRFLDRVQIKNDGDDPLYVFRERLRRFFGKDGILRGSRLWIPWADRWTYCIAVRPEDPDELARGIFYINRAVYEEAS